MANMSGSFLERIVAATREVVAERQADVPLEEMRARAAAAPAPRDFATALLPAPSGSARLIAEVKRASPSKGLLAERFDPVALARAYEAGGAAAISVLTEPHFFLGSLEHLRAVREAVGIPVLRKDFVLDPYQIYEARAAGADALLLICALLDDTELRDLLALTRSLGMEALVEIHTEEEADRAYHAGAKIVGANSRDLRTFEVDPDVVRHLREYVGLPLTFVAESGISDALGATRARVWGADAILVGEALMRAPDPQAKARELSSAAGGGTRQLFPLIDDSFVKICGITRPEHGFFLGRLQVHAFGLVFALSRRQVIPELARRIVEAASIGTAVDIGMALANENLDDINEEGPRWRVPFDLVVPPLAVGVFVNESSERIESIARYVGLGAIQLSGDETPEQCADLLERTGLPVIKALRVGSKADLAQLDIYATAGATLLLDTPKAGSYGGTGRTSNWHLAREAAQRWPVLLSGGLTPGNVSTAIAMVRPRGVDVSSGVETDGVKDPRKMLAFTRNALMIPDKGKELEE